MSIKKNGIKFFIFLFLSTLNLFSQGIDLKKPKQNILEYASYYIDVNNLSFEEIKMLKTFKKVNTEHFNFGFVKKEVIWIKISIENSLATDIQKVLEIKNPLLEEITLYTRDGFEKSGMLHIDKFRTYIQPSFTINLEANRSQVFYLKIKNSTTALRFGIFLKDKNLFIKEEHTQQVLIMIFIGIILALFLYNILLYVYSREKSYLYYALYLGILLAQQLTYLGITPLLFPYALVYIDNLSVVFKVNMMFIMATLFAQSFLQTLRYKNIHKIYNGIIILALIEIPLFGTPWFYYPEVGILTGLLFVMFNIFAGTYIYREGYKQARFFVVAWSVLVIGFILMILDGLGIISIMHKIPNIIMYSTALEALLLSLAFTDRYILLRQAKESSDTKLFNTLQDRQSVIEEEIKRQTTELSFALENKKILLQELQHRTKNNLQLILSLVRMQLDDSQEMVKEKFEDLDFRIRAIAKTHELLYLKDDLEQIPMDEYIFELCHDLEESVSSRKIIIDTQASHIYLPLSKASYTGLIINELVTNAIKYANKENILINIIMKKEGKKYLLNIKDNGKGCDMKKLEGTSLGITLVKILLKYQLEGSMKVENNKGLNYRIEYKV